MMHDYTILTEQQAWAELNRLLLMLDLQPRGSGRERELCERLANTLTTEVVDTEGWLTEALSACRAISS